MASPAKAYIDPVGTYSVPNIFFQRPLVISNKFIQNWIAPVQIEELGSNRWNILAPLVTAVPLKLFNINQSYALQGNNYTISTYSAIYQERGASASRLTEGQVYPTGI